MDEDEEENATGNVLGEKKPKEAGICIDSSRIQTSSKIIVFYG